MVKKIFLITFITAFLVIINLNAEEKAITYATFDETIDSLLPKNGIIEKDTVIITKKHAKELKKIYNAGYKKGRRFEIYLLKNADSTIDSYVLRLKLTIEEFESEHDYIFQFAKNKTKLKKVDLLALNDEYAELAKQSDFFFKQFENVGDVDTLELDENIDAVTEATLTSELTVGAVRIAKYLLDLL